MSTSSVHSQLFAEVFAFVFAVHSGVFFLRMVPESELGIRFFAIVLGMLVSAHQSSYPQPTVGRRFCVLWDGGMGGCSTGWVLVDFVL